MYAKEFVENISVELRYLVQAGDLKIAPVYIFPEAVVLHLVQPAGEVCYKTRLCRRKIKHKHQRP